MRVRYDEEADALYIRSLKERNSQRKTEEEGWERTRKVACPLSGPLLTTEPAKWREVLWKR